MASVVGFWRFPDEEPPFLACVLKSGPVMAVPHGTVRDRADLEPVPLGDMIATGRQHILMMPAALAASLPISSGPDVHGEWSYSVDAMVAPVITYQRGTVVAPMKLSMSNLSARSTIFQDDETRALPAEFVRWHQRVLKWARTSTPLWHRYKTYRITERVAAAVQEGWELVY